MRCRRGTAAAAVAVATALAGATGSAAASGRAVAPPIAADTVVGDAVPRALTATPGDALRGRAIVADRRVGLCLLCHPGPIPEERSQGDLAPDLAGAGARWSEGQLRLRLIDARRLNAATIMPSYHRLDGGRRIGEAWQGKPVLDAQQIEDVIAYLVTLR